jgi:hypothetical protein
LQTQRGEHGSGKNTGSNNSTARRHRQAPEEMRKITAPPDVNTNNIKQSNNFPLVCDHIKLAITLKKYRSSDTAPG